MRVTTMCFREVAHAVFFFNMARVETYERGQVTVSSSRASNSLAAGHFRMTIFQMAVVAIPERLFRSMLSRIHRIGRACARAPALSL